MNTIAPFWMWGAALWLVAAVVFCWAWARWKAYDNKLWGDDDDQMLAELKAKGATDDDILGDPIEDNEALKLMRQIEQLQADNKALLDQLSTSRQLCKDLCAVLEETATELQEREAQLDLARGASVQ